MRRLVDVVLPFSDGGDRNSELYSQIVLLVTVILALFSLALILFLPESLPASLVMFAVVFVLLIFYVRHYFFLENTVQYWYLLSEKISDLQNK